MGHETADQAHARFAAAVMGVVGEHPEDNLVIVTHGTVMTLFIARALAWEPFPLWKRLGLPSWVAFSRPRMALQALVETVEPPNEGHSS